MSGRLILSLTLILSIVTTAMCQIISVPMDYPTIQGAIISATNGDTVHVSPGTYYESINFLGKEITVRGANRNTTVIDGGGSVCVTNPFYLEELTIRNGSPGILGDDVSARIGNIRNCIIEENYFGLDAWGSYDIINSIFRNNSGHLGAAVKWSENGYGELNISNTAFISNECANYPALYKPTNNGAPVNITNCTIAGNRATQQVVLSGSGINIKNTIIYHNILDNYPHLLMQGTINVSYSDLQVDFPGSGNINSDPQFADLESEDLQLLSSSPCIDAGNPSSPLDPDGTIADMGAYYYDQSSETNIDSSGLFLLRQYSGIYEAYIFNNSENEWTASFTDPPLGQTATIMSSVFHSKTNTIYVLSEYSDIIELYSYSPEDNIWIALDSPPITGGVTDLYPTYDDINEKILLVRKFNDFVDLNIYDAATNSWESNIQQPESWGGIDDIAWVYHHYTNRSYLVREYGGNSWMYSYDYDTNSWRIEDSLLPLSASLANLSATSNTSDNQIYITGQDFVGVWIRAYNPSSYFWEDNLSGPPLNGGGVNSLSLTYDFINDDVLLMRKYENFIDIYAFDPENDTWRDNLAQPVTTGGISNVTTSFYSFLDEEIPPYDESILYVSVEGSDNQGNGSEHLPLRTIQHAINRASVGDTILVDPGQYFENINLSNKELTLSSHYIDDADTSLIANTIIDGSNNDYVIRVYNSEITLIGLTVSNGHAASGGGIYSISGEYLSVQNCVVSNNIASSSGGAIYHNLGYLELVNTIVTNNESYETGGGLTAMGDSVYIFDSQFIGNIANNAGGAIYHQNSILDIRGSLFGSNSVVGQGGGLYAQGGELSISSSSFESNSSSGSMAGAIYAGGNCNLTGDSLRFISNNSSDPGGAVQIEHTTAALSHTLFTGNTATTSGQAIHISNIANLNLEFCTLDQNGSNDGAVSIFDGSILNVTNSILWGSPNAQIEVLDAPTASTIEISYCNIQNGAEGIDDQSGDLSLTWGAGNISGDPLFDSDLTSRLTANSPCIDVGNPDFDSDGYSWEVDPDDRDPDGTRLDMGAYYYSQDGPYHGPTWYVSTDGSDETGDGSIDLPYQTIQWAVSACSIQDTVILLPGSYEIESPIEFPEFPIIIRSSEGFPNTSIIGSQYPVLLSNTAPSICLSTIQGITFEEFSYIGQGLQYLPHFEECKFSNIEYTGGIFNMAPSDSIAQFDHCIFAQNTAHNSPIDGLFTGTSFYVNFTNCSFAWNANGIFRIDYGGVTFNNCIVRTGLGAINQTSKQANYSFIEYPDEFNISSMYECIDGQVQGSPGFVDEAGGNLMLVSNSICIDAGNPDLDGDGDTWETDIDDQDPDGTRLDIGALYFNQIEYSGPVWYVSTDGSDETGNGSTDYPFETLQSGIDHMMNGDTLLLLPGIYYQSFNSGEKSITIKGEMGSGNTFVDFQNFNTAETNENIFFVALQEAIHVSIEGLTFRNKWSESQNESFFYLRGETNHSLNLSLIDVVFKDNLGQAIEMLHNVSLEVDTCFFINNHAGGIDGGAIKMGDAPSTIACSLSVNRSSFSNNSAQKAGAILAEGGYLSISGSFFNNNNDNFPWTLEQGGGGALFIDDTCRAYIQNSSFTQNTAQRVGGAISIHNSSIVNISQSVILNNEAVYGGGIVVINCDSVQIDECDISYNYASTFGGGMVFGESVHATINNSIISNNESGDNAGGIYCAPCNLEINNSEITDNSAIEYGAGVVLNFTNPVENTILNNVTISGNDAGVYAGGLFMSNQESVEVILNNSIIWDNEPHEVYMNPNGTINQLTVSYSDIQEGLTGIVQNGNGSINWQNGNIETAPAFTDGGNGDYSLLISSPCIDSGDPDLDEDGYYWGVDLDDQDEDGTRLDIGALSVFQEDLNPENNSIAFDGIDDFVSVPYEYSPETIGQARTIAAWVRPEDLSPRASSSVGEIAYAVALTQQITASYSGAHWGGIGIELSEDPKFQAIGYDGQVPYTAAVGSTTPIVGEWSHLALVFNGNTLKLFVNGIEEGSQSFTGFSPTSIGGNAALVIGNHLANQEFNYSFPGFVDGVKLWNRALLPSELRNLVSSAPSISLTDSLIGDWRLDEGDGNIIFDQSESVYSTDGTISGGIWSRLNAGSIDYRWRHFVSTTGSNETGDGSEAFPYATIQFGIDAARSGDTVLVQPGTYVENINYHGKNIVVGSLTLTTGDTSFIVQTTIDGNQTGSVVTFTNSEDSTAVLCGFTIQNGNADPAGGGVYCHLSNPTLSNLMIQGNSAIYKAGGVYLSFSDALIQNSTIKNNSVSGDGGGIYCLSSNPIIEDVLVVNNSAHQGGGIFINDSSPLFTDFIIQGNNATTHGGGISCWYNSNPILSRGLIASNSAGNDGAGIYLWTSILHLVNVTMSDNAGSGDVGVIYNYESNNFITNCIIWNNTPIEIYNQSGESNVTYSNIQNGWEGIGNFDLDPLFVNADNSDYYLNYNSPCIDSGDPSAPLDPDNTRADMGAYYFEQSGSWGDAPDRLWTRISGSTDNDSPVQIIQSPSSTDVVVLSNYRATDTQTNVIMMEKYNLDGDRLWTQFYDGSTYLIPTAVTLTDDNGYYILFYTFSTVTGFRHLGLIKTDENGNEIWRQIYAFDDYDSPRDIIRSNGELVILFEGALGVSVMGLDFEGQVLWTKYHSYFADAARIIATSDSGFAVVGMVGDGDRDAYLLKLDSDGEEEWHQIYGGDLHQDGNDIVQLADESFVFCGYSQVQASMDYAGWLYKVDSSGETVWERSFPTVGHKVFRAMCPTNDGGFALIGDIPFDEIGVQTLILKTDSEGSLEWETGGLFPIHNWGVDLIETADQGFIAVGQVAVDGGSNDLDIWVTRFEGELDIIPPDVQLNNPDITEAIHIGDTLAVTWTASDNFALDWAKLFFTSNGGASFSLYDSVDANLGGLEWVAPDVISNSCNFAIWVSDISGNVSADTLSGSFVIIDATPPLISILSPTQTTSIREHDSLFVAWIALDNIGIDWFELWYSNKPSDPFESLGQISGDDTTFAFGIGAGVSDSARIKMDVMDVAGNLAEDYSEYFSIIDNTSPVISHFSIPDTSDWGIGSIMDIGVVATDNVEITGLDLNYSSDNGANWWPIIEELYPVQGQPTYSWLIPDIPGECQIQAIVMDAVGLTDTSYSEVFTIYVEYPRMIASLPEIRPDGNMYLRFSQRMDSLDIASGTQVVGSVHGAYDIEGSLNGDDLTITTTEGFVSLDTLQVVLTSSLWTNSFGYGLDGNGDGLYGGNSIDNDTSYTIVTAAGDYDQNGVLNFDDFDDFVIAWNNDVSDYELAPHQGEIPFINIQPDSIFDIFDLATFASMWNWAAGIYLSAPLTESYQYEEFISEQNGNELEVSLPLGDYVASQTIIKYNPNVVQISVADDGLAKVSSSGLSMVDVNPDSGFILITSSHLTDSNEDDLNLKLFPETKQRYSIEIAIQGSDMDANVIQKRTLVELLPIPTSFSLSQNYPNPFNANTTIEYGIPKNSDLSISIYDIRGRFVKDVYSGEKQAGYHVTHWNGSDESGRNVASGLYFIVLNTPEYRVARKALILK